MKRLEEGGHDKNPETDLREERNREKLSRRQGTIYFGVERSRNWRPNIITQLSKSTRDVNEIKSLKLSELEKEGVEPEENDEVKEKTTSHK